MRASGPLRQDEDEGRDRSSERKGAVWRARGRDERLVENRRRWRRAAWSGRTRSRTTPCATPWSRDRRRRRWRCRRRMRWHRRRNRPVESAIQSPSAVPRVCENRIVISRMFRPLLSIDATTLFERTMPGGEDATSSAAVATSRRDIRSRRAVDEIGKGRADGRGRDDHGQ